MNMHTSRHLVPGFIYDKYRTGETHGSFNGAALFVDLSGFSKMTDVLSTHGQHGAEVLAEMMRVVFEPLVSAVYAQGGFVIGYAGDAFNAVFPAGQAKGSELKRCLSSAIAMQAHAKSHPQASTPYGAFPIHIKVGFGFGETKWQIFKSRDGAHATFWFRGDSLAGAVEGEEHARSDEIVVHADAYAHIRDVVRVLPVENCFLIEEVAVDLPAPPPYSPPKLVDDIVGIFFPDSVAHLPIAGEFRQVVNLFIDIPESISDEALIAPFMEAIYVLQEKYGGFFLRPDLGDKGFNLLVIWGAPVSHENDVDRALNFILELSARVQLPLRGGISYRVAYTGFIGASHREDYTAYGWGVNLAARLMEHAAVGEFWMDDEVARRAGRHFNIKYLDEYQFKGFKQRQKTYSLVGRKDISETIYEGYLVGRAEEMAILASFVEPVKRGRFAGMMVLKGEAGIGKSRLVHSFQHSDYFKDFSANWVVCQTDEILRESFNPFRAWLNRQFDFVDGQPDEVNLVSFNRKLQELINVTSDPALSGELTRTSSVLAALLNISQPDSLFEKLDAKGRYDNTLIALSVLLRAVSLQKPLVLFVEDMHWLDDDTEAFLLYFVRTLLAEPDKEYPIAIIATQRPDGESFHAKDEFSAQEINLGKLSSASLGGLAENILGSPISDSLLSLLNARADGNPFFAEQILRYLSEQGALTLDADGKYLSDEQAQTSLPMDVRAVMIARLDQLTQHVRDVVQTASVLGREFETRVLGAMLQNDFEVPLHMAQAEKSNIWAPLNEIEYIFKHALLRDAAYSMQLVSRQRELHGLAVQSLETLYRDDLEPHYGELAYHAEKADMREKALGYLNLAGKLSLSVYQNQQAIDYFTRALALTPMGDLRARFDLTLKRAECYYNISNHTAQLKDLDSLEELAGQIKDDGLLARAHIRRSYYFSALGDFQGVLTYATRAKELAEMPHDDESILATYLVIPNALLRLGRMSESLQFAKEGLAFARDRNARQKEGSMLSILGLVSLDVEGPTIAMNYQEQALEIAREIKDRYLEAMTLNNLANTVGLSLGDFSTARSYFEQAYSISHELGNINGKGITLLNLGWLTGILGDYPAAINYYEQSLTILREVGNRSQEMYIYINLSAAAGGQGNVLNAFKWAQEALELSTNLGDRTGISWAYFYLGYSYLLTDKFDEAVQAFLKSIEIRLEINAPVLVAEARAGLINVYFEMGDPISAKGEAERVLEYMDKNKSFKGAEEPLRMFLAVVRVLEKTKDPRVPVVLQNAIQLLNTQVSKLSSEEARRMYIENVPWRREIHQIAKANGLLD